MEIVEDEHRTGRQPTRVSTIELFFDLVFVLTITQVASVIVASPDVTGVAQAGLELAVIFWMYGGYAWLTNTSQPDTPARRAVLLAAIAAFLVCSTAVPTAFYGGGIVFGVGYVAIVVIHGAGFVIYSGATRRALRVLAWNLAAAGLVLGAGWTHGSATWILWTAAVLLQLSIPLAIRAGSDYRINVTHFGERHGLVVLIALGESLLSVALASSSERVDHRVVIGALAGLLVIAALWWLYFGGDDERAVVALQDAPVDRRPVWAITGYLLAHLPMIFGILLLAAGAQLGADDLLAPASQPSAWLVALGAGAFAFGSAAFRHALHFADPVPRAVAALGCLLTVPLGRSVSTAAELAAIAAVLLLSTASGARSHSRHADALGR